MHPRVSKTSAVNFFRPSSSQVDQIVKLFDAGMTMARVNLSHGGIKENLKLIQRFKQAKRLRPHKTCALMLEVRGREIRVSTFNETTARIRSGSTVTLLGGEFHAQSDPENFRINCETVQRFLKPNDVVYFDDGKVVGIISEIDNAENLQVKMEIKIGGIMKSSASVRFTGNKHMQKALITKQDIQDIQAISQIAMIDYLAVPFISSGLDAKQVREALGPSG